MKKWHLLVVLFTALALGGYYYSQYDFRNNIKSMAPDFEMSSMELFEIYDQDEEAANNKYLGKLIAVNGLVTAFTKSSDQVTVSLGTGDPMSEIVCELNLAIIPEDLLIEVGDPITIKGEISGKLIDIIMVNSVIIN